MTISRYVLLKVFRFSFHLYYFLCRYISLLPTNITRRVLAHKLSLNMRDLRGWTLFIEGSAQVEKIRVLKSLTTFVDDFAFIDVGANYGEFINVIDFDNVAKMEKCLLIEANPLVFSLLVKTLEVLSFSEADKKKICAINRALVEDGNPSKTVTFLTNEKYSGGGSLLKTHSQSNKLQLVIPTVRVSEALSSLSISPATALIIKMDIEGYELTVLPDITNYLKQSSISDFAILFEIHLKRNDSHSFEKLRQLLDENYMYMIFPNISVLTKVDLLLDGQYDFLLLSKGLYERSHTMFQQWEDK